MRLTATRPNGARLTPFGPQKVKGIMQVHNSVDTAGGQWNAMWGVHYDWTGWLKPGIDVVAAMGANTIKICGPNSLIMSGTTLPNSYRDRIRTYLDYTASIGLRVYWLCQSDRYTNGASTTTQAQDVAMVTEQARIIADYPHVIGLDMENEYNFPFSTDPAFLIAARASVKAVAPQLPVTISLTDDYFRSPALLAPFAAYVDYWDFHWYEPTDTPGPTMTTVTAFRSSPYYKPFIIGESGTPLNGLAGVAQGVNAIQAHWTLLGDFGRTAVDCMGVVGFSLTNFDSEGFGVYPEDFSTPKSSSYGPFQLWQSVR